MANLKSSKKDVRRTLKRTIANRQKKSKVRTLLKKAKSLISTSTNFEEANKALVAYESVAMKRSSRKLFSKKSSAHKVSALRKQIKEKFKDVA